MNFKIGNKVKCVDNSGPVGADLSIGKRYTVLKYENLCVWIDNGEDFGYLASHFTLAEPEEVEGLVYCKDGIGCEVEGKAPISCKSFIPRKITEPVYFKVGDRVCFYRPVRITGIVYDISLPSVGIRVKLDNGTLVYVDPEKLLKISDDPKWESVPCVMPPITRIIHNGTTTITQFSDGSKIITRPSEDDADKYDPYVGWCVGVTAKLFGGKVAAKKFYKAHAVVQKAVERAKVDFTIDPVKKCIESYLEGYGTPGWQGKEEEKVESEGSEARKQYNDSVSKRHCYVCEGYHSLSNFAPCKGCWGTGKAGHHPHFTPKPFKE